MSFSEEITPDETSRELESLPYDVLFGVLSLVPRETLQSARLACKALRKGAQGLLSRLRVDVSTLRGPPFCFSSDPDPWLSFISRLELFSSGQKLKVPSLALPPPVQVQHSLEAYALQALLIAVQQEAHATSVHTATQAAQRHAQAAREAKGMVAKACEAAVNGEGEAHALVQEAVAAGAAAAAAAEQAAQEAAAASAHAAAASDETCVIYAIAAAASAAAAEAAACSAQAAGHAAALFREKPPPSSDFASCAWNAASLANHAVNIATVAARTVMVPAASPVHHQQQQQQQWVGGVEALRLAFAAARQGAEAAAAYAAMQHAHAGNAPVELLSTPDVSLMESSLLPTLAGGAAKAVEEAQELCSRAASALGGVLPLQSKKQQSAAAGGQGGPVCGLPPTSTCPPVHGALLQGVPCWPSMQELALDVLRPAVAKVLYVLQPAAFPSLRRLELRRFSAEPLHKAPLWDALAHMSQLRELLILGWDLEPEDQQGLPRLTHLTQLTVAHSQNNGEGLRCLSHLTNLQELQLDTLRYDATIQSEFCGLSQLRGLSCLRFKTVGPLYDEVTSLSGLPLVAFEVSSHFEASLPDAIERMLLSSTCLRELVLTHFELNDSLAECLRGHPNFKSLSIGRINRVSPSRALENLEDLSLHFVELPTHWEQPLSVLTPRLRSLRMSQFNSIPLMIDPTLPATLVSELFPLDAPPLTSLLSLKAISTLLVPQLVASTPNVEHLEVVIPWAENEARSLAYTAQAQIAAQIGDVSIKLLESQAFLQPSSSCRSSMLNHLDEKQMSEDLMEARAELRSGILCCANLLLMLSGPPQVQHALRHTLPAHLPSPEIHNQPTFLATLQRCLEHLQPVATAVGVCQDAASIHLGQGLALEDASRMMQSLIQAARDANQQIRPFLAACWDVLKRHQSDVEQPAPQSDTEQQEQQQLQQLQQLDQQQAEILEHVHQMQALQQQLQTQQAGLQDQQPPQQGHPQPQEEQQQQQQQQQEQEQAVLQQTAHIQQHPQQGLQLQEQPAQHGHHQGMQQLGGTEGQPGILQGLQQLTAAHQGDAGALHDHHELLYEHGHHEMLHEHDHHGVSEEGAAVLPEEALGAEQHIQHLGLDVGEHQQQEVQQHGMQGEHQQTQQEVQQQQQQQQQQGIQGWQEPLLPLLPLQQQEQQQQGMQEWQELPDIPGLVLQLVDMHQGWMVLEPGLHHHQQQQQQQQQQLLQQQHVEVLSRQFWEQQLQLVHFESREQQTQEQHSQEQQHQQEDSVPEQLVRKLRSAVQHTWADMQGRSWVVQASKWACLSSVSLIDNEQSLRVDDLQAIAHLLPRARISLHGPGAYVPQV